MYLKAWATTGLEEGADHVEGIARVDDKTVRFTTKAPMSLITFNSSYARYLMPLPKHVIGDIGEKALASDPWFSHPDVVSGPYKVTEFDRDHYVSYEANKDYWKGAPVIERLNIKLWKEASSMPGLKSGEIDITQNTMSTIPWRTMRVWRRWRTWRFPTGAPITNQRPYSSIQPESPTQRCARPCCTRWTAASSWSSS